MEYEKKRKREEIVRCLKIFNEQVTAAGFNCLSDVDGKTMTWTRR